MKEKLTRPALNAKAVLAPKVVQLPIKKSFILDRIRQ
jgi:hypothetical protein